jgi:YD repeat-containing protein
LIRFNPLIINDNGSVIQIDEAARLCQITLTDAKKQVTRWRYDARGKLAAKTYPDKSIVNKGSVPL